MWSLLLAGEFKGGSFTGWFERSIESIYFATYTHKLCLHGLSILHQKCKVRVIMACTQNSMMISIIRNHQEGEEHAKRSSVSSLVRWLFEGIVLTLEPKKY